MRTHLDGGRRHRSRGVLVPAALLGVCLVMGTMPVAFADDDSVTTSGTDTTVTTSGPATMTPSPDPTSPTPSPDPTSPTPSLEPTSPTPSLPLVDGPIDPYADGAKVLKSNSLAALACAARGTPTSAEAQRAIARACEMVGGRYVFGGGHGSVPGPTYGGLDCSGLVRYAYYNPATWRDKLGPGSTRDQYALMSKGGAAQIIGSTASLKPGDIVYWSSNGTAGGIYHATLYLGDSYYVHAANEDAGILVSQGSQPKFFKGVRLNASPVRDLISDFNGDGKADVFAVNGVGELRVYLNVGRPAFAGRSTIGHGWQNMKGVMAADWSGDGAADVLAISAAGDLLYYPNNAHSLSSGVKVGHGWQNMKGVMAADWSGDGRADILAVDPAGNLQFYQHASGNAFKAPIQIGRGWQGMTRVMAADWNHDGRADILAVDAAGTLWVYPHGVGNTFASPFSLGHGWNGPSKVWASDASGDGYADVMAVAEGKLLYYAHNGAGLLDGAVVGTDWQSFKFVF